MGGANACSNTLEPAPPIPRPPSTLFHCPTSGKVSTAFKPSTNTASWPPDCRLAMHTENVVTSTRGWPSASSVHGWTTSMACRGGSDGQRVLMRGWGGDGRGRRGGSQGVLAKDCPWQTPTRRPRPPTKPTHPHPFHLTIRDHNGWAGGSHQRGQHRFPAGALPRLRTGPSIAARSCQVHAVSDGSGVVPQGLLLNQGLKNGGWCCEKWWEAARRRRIAALSRIRLPRLPLARSATSSHLACGLSRRMLGVSASMGIWRGWNF